MLDGADDCIVLRLCDETIAQAAFRSLFVGITQTEREVELAAVVLHADVEVAFGRAPVALTFLVVGRVETERDCVGANDAPIGIEFESARAFADQDARRDERQFERREWRRGG